MSSEYESKRSRFGGWQTPPEFFKALDEEFGFTLDAAASHENALCEMYSTLDGTFLRGEGRLSHADGLECWDGLRVFCNPPYTTEALKAFVNKAFQFEADVAVLLLPPNMETEWGQRLRQTRAKLPMIYLQRWREYQKSLEQVGYLRTMYREPTPWTEMEGTPTVELRFPPGRLQFLRPAFKEYPLPYHVPVLRQMKRTGYELKDYAMWGEEIFDYSKPSVKGEAPRSGNLIAIFRK